ncbi:MAG: efflux transporter outer membrane subunit, partial [Verrucomicrobiota bacterium]
SIFVPTDRTYNEFRAALNLEYEIDLWGRVRQSVESARAEFEAAEADWAATRLSLRAELARTYYNLRFIDAEIHVLRKSLEVRDENRRLVDARVRGGETTDLDLARAETELEATRAQLLSLERTRATYFNALAFLVGEVPASFELPKGGIVAPPVIPSGLPSELLTRRPDIAAADARMRATTAQIGVVRASYLPRINLIGVGGLTSLEIEDFLNPSSFFGEIGPSVELPIYNAGRSGLDEDRAFANSDEAIGVYRETALGAFRDVEDALSGIRFLDLEIYAHRRAAASAERAERLSQKRYDGGLVSYLEVVDAQRTSLGEERELVQAKAARLLATVQLIEALGGGWEVEILDPEEG